MRVPARRPEGQRGDSRRDVELAPGSGEGPWIHRRHAHELLRSRLRRVAPDRVVLAAVQPADRERDALPLVGRAVTEIIRDRHARADHVVVLERGDGHLLPDRGSLGRAQPAVRAAGAGWESRATRARASAFRRSDRGWSRASSTADAARGSSARSSSSSGNELRRSAHPRRSLTLTGFCGRV